MIIQAELKYKEPVYDGEPCVVDKVIELPDDRFKQFGRAVGRSRLYCREQERHPV